MIKIMKINLICFLLISLSAFPLSASADWFLSAETKALIVKAEEGDAEAQIRVALAYDTGRGAPRDRDSAMKWYRVAADGGNAEAQNSLGSMFQEKKDYKDAMFWYEKAASLGHAQATNSMGYLHDLGLGVPQNRIKGFELYSQAADLGWAEAMWDIANMYGAGQLGAVDERMACVWIVRASRFARPRDRQLSAHLAGILPKLQRRLTPDDLASCQEQGTAWSPAAIAKAK
jgi:TPR repeat protein